MTAKLGRFVLFAYGAPGLPLAALLLPLYVFLPAFYAEHVGLGFAAVGAALLAARLWDMATDPLIGMLSDRMSSRWGRRRPWLLLGTPVVMISAWFLFVPGSAVGVPYLIVWSAVLYLGATMIQLPYQAWGAELSADYHGRTRIAAAREVQVVFGTLLAAALPALLAGGTPAAMRGLAWMILLALPIAVVLAVRFVPEGPLVRPNWLGWRRGIRLLAANRPFRRLIAAYFLNGIANGLPASLFLLFVAHVLERPDSSGLLLFVYFLCGIAAVPLWLGLSRRFGKHRVWMGAMIWACAVFVWVPLLGPGDLWWFVVVCVLTGASLGADLVLPPSMQADVVDEDTLESGTPRTGLYFALWGLVTKLALALAVGLSFPLLELAGFGGADGAGLFALAALYGLAPVVFKLGAVALMRGFPITAERQAEIRRLIAARAVAAAGNSAATGMNRNAEMGEQPLESGSGTYRMWRHAG